MPGQVLISERSSCQISTMLAHVCQSCSSDGFSSREHKYCFGSYSGALQNCSWGPLIEKDSVPHPVGEYHCYRQKSLEFLS